ncbi:hypothetical protein EGJ52_13620 [Pseudomonas luteola]|nr:hypothetical protein EGJ52_13620 [Pseudomonas luteola]
MGIQFNAKVLSETAVTVKTITDYWRQGVCSARMLDIEWPSLRVMKQLLAVQGADRIVQVRLPG